MIKNSLSFKCFLNFKIAFLPISKNPRNRPMKSLLRLFLFAFLLLFSSQRIIDNECICGGIGVSEDNCVFASIPHSNQEDHHDDKHVCTNCPCNYILISYSNLYLNTIFTHNTMSYIVSPLFTAVNFDYLVNLIRPPRSSLI